MATAERSKHQPLPQPSWALCTGTDVSGPAWQMSGYLWLISLQSSAQLATKSPDSCRGEWAADGRQGLSQTLHSLEARQSGFSLHVQPAHLGLPNTNRNHSQASQLPWATIWNYDTGVFSIWIVFWLWEDKIVQCLGTVGLHFSLIWLLCWSEHLVELPKTRLVVTPCCQPGLSSAPTPWWALSQVFRTQVF